MIDTTFKQGELRKLKPGIVPSDLAPNLGDSPDVTVIRMEHEYGYNRFVMVELGDDDKTRMIVRPDDLY